MPYLPHYRLTVSGVYRPQTTDLEIFSFGLAFGIRDATPSGIGPLPNSVFTSVVAACQTFFGSTDTALSSLGRATRVKVAQIGPDGTYDQAPQEAVINTQGGGSNSNVRPLQVSLAVSLQGPPAVRRRTGRFYLPYPCQPYDPNAAAITTGSQGQAAGAAVLWIETLNNLLAPVANGLGVCIASQSGTKGPAENAPVTNVRVGRILDTQRRRRNALVEAYVTNAVSNPPQ